jgi:hypothetical protein
MPFHLYDLLRRRQSGFHIRRLVTKYFLSSSIRHTAACAPFALQ